MEIESIQRVYHAIQRGYKMPQRLPDHAVTKIDRAKS
jgi:hypothetical protein